MAVKQLPKSAPVLLTRRELANELHCSQKHVKSLEDRGLLLATHLGTGGKGVRYSRANVDAMLTKLTSIAPP